MTDDRQHLMTIAEHAMQLQRSPKKTRADMFLVCNSKTRGHNMKLCVQYSRIDVRKLFSNRVVQPWNSLKAQPAD